MKCCSDGSKLSELIFRIYRLMRQKTVAGSKYQRLTILQSHILTYLSENEAPSMQDLSEAFKITMPTGTAVIDTLIKQELVKRIKVKGDRRKVNISLSAKGSRLVSKLNKHRENRFTESLDLLSSKDKYSLLNILEKLTKRMESTI